MACIGIDQVISDEGRVMDLKYFKCYFMACIRIHVYWMISDGNDQRTEGLISFTSVVFPV